MKVELDLSFLKENLFTGPMAAELLLDRVQGNGYLFIKLRPGQVVTSSFMYGLLKSHRFQGIEVSDNSHNDLHRSEVKRATERYSKLGKAERESSIQRYSESLRGGLTESEQGDWVSYQDHIKIVDALSEKIQRLQKSVSDASWDADARREEAEQRRHQEWR